MTAVSETLLQDYRAYLNKTMSARQMEFMNAAQDIMAAVRRENDLPPDEVIRQSLFRANNWKAHKIKKFRVFLQVRGLAVTDKGQALNSGCHDAPQQAFTRFLMTCYSRGRMESTMSNYKQRFAAFADYLDSCGIDKLSEVSMRVLEGYKDYLYRRVQAKSSKPYSSRMRMFFVQFVKQFFRYLCAEGVISYNPAARLRLPLCKSDLLRTPPGKEQVLQLLTSQKHKSVYERRNFMIIYLSCFCGMRSGEICGLRLQDLDFENNLLHIRQSKGAKDRTIPLIEPCRGMLKIYLSQVRPRIFQDNYRRGKTKHEGFSENDLVFPGRLNKGRMMKTSLRGILHQAMRQAGFKQTDNFHSLRAAFATNMLRSGLGVRYVQQLLGHNRLDTTGRYARLNMDDLRQVLRRYHPRESA